MMTTNNGTTQWGTLQIDTDTSGANTVTSIVAQGPFIAMRADPIVVVGEEPADDSGSNGLSGGIIAVIVLGALHVVVLLGVGYKKGHNGRHVSKGVIFQAYYRSRLLFW